MNWLSGQLHGIGYGGPWRPERYSDNSNALESIKVKGKLNIIAAYELTESRIERLHAIGDSFTVVDLYLLVFYRWGIAIELEIEKDFPKYTTLIANLVKRDAVVETLEEVKLPPLFAPKV